MAKKSFNLILANEGSDIPTVILSDNGIFCSKFIASYQQ